MRFDLPKAMKEKKFFEKLADDLHISISHIDRRALESTEPKDNEVIAIYKVELCKARINCSKRLDMLRKKMWTLEKSGDIENQEYSSIRTRIEYELELEQHLNEIKKSIS
jgi:hypothetical protein